MQIYADSVRPVMYMYEWENKMKHLRKLNCKNPMEDKQENSWGINLKIIFWGTATCYKT